MAQLSQERARRVSTWLLVVAAIAFAALRAPFLSLPLERDEGEYAYVAWRMLEGEVPYRDAFDQKPPGVFLAYLGAFSLLGRSTEAIHLFAHLWNAGTAALLFLLLRRLAGGLAAALGVFVFAVVSTDASVGATAANTEVFMLLPMVASLLCLERAVAEERAGWWLACGALAAVACWFKQVAGTSALFLALVAAVDVPAAGAGERARLILRRYAWLMLGALVLSVPVIAAFAAAGALQPFVDAVFLHNLEYSQRKSLGQGLASLGFALRWQAPGFAVLWLLALWAVLRPRLAGRRAWGLLAGWWVASLAGAALGLHFRPHYFIQALPALAGLCGVALAAAARPILARPEPRLAWGGIAALVLLVLVPPVVASRGALFAGSPEAISRRIYGLNPFPEAAEIARYVARTSEPDESVYVVGSEPQIFFYAARRSATRYIYFYPLTGGYPDAPERQREAIAEVEASEPRYVVWVNVPTSLLAADGGDPYIFEATNALLRRAYRLEFVARLDERLESYEFVYGSEARRWVFDAGTDLQGLPWLAVYRRAGLHGDTRLR
jgi:4-amino-4-deoxy-L-arabinose transferase-like glycosyltransferase